MARFINRATDRHRLIRQFSKSIRSMPYLSMAFGLYWMMTVLFLYSPFLFEGSSAATFPRPPAGMVTSAVSIVAYFAAAARFRSYAAFDAKKWSYGVLAVAMTLGTLLYVLSLSERFSLDFSVFLYVSGLVLLGAGTAGTCLEVARIFAYAGAQKVLFHGAVALLGGSIGAFAVSLLPQIASGFILVAIPLPMIACLRRCFADMPLKRIFAQGVKGQAHVPRRFLVTSAIQGLALGVMHNLLASLDLVSASLSAVGFCVAAVLLVVTAIVIMQDFNTLFYRVGFPIMAMGFFIVGTFDGTLLLGSVLLDAGYCYQYLISCCLCAYLAKSLDQSPIWIVGLSTGCLLLGQFAGGVLAACIHDASISASILAVVVLLAALYLFSNGNMRSGWGSVRPGTSEETLDARDESCQAVAAESGLSPRESDVCLLLAKGYTRKEISQRLHLSEETIKSHTGKIYQKLAIHSKRELVALVEERMKSFE